MKTVSVYTGEQLLSADRLQRTARIELAVPARESSDARRWDQRVNQRLKKRTPRRGFGGGQAGRSTWAPNKSTRADHERRFSASRPRSVTCLPALSGPAAKPSTGSTAS